MSEKVLKGFYEKDAWSIAQASRTSSASLGIEENKFVPVVLVEEIEKVIKERPCKSCEYFTDWLKELKSRCQKNE